MSLGRRAPSGRLGELDPHRIPSPLAHMSARDLYALHGYPSTPSSRLTGEMVPRPGGLSGSYVKFLLAVLVVSAAAVATTFVDALVYGTSGAGTPPKPAVVVTTPSEPAVVEEIPPTPEPGVEEFGATEESVVEAGATVDSAGVVPEPAPTEPAKPAVVRPRTPVKPAVKPAARTRPRRVLTRAEREEAAKQAEKARKKRLKDLEKARKEREKRRRP
jgi:hypothetical protein